MLLWVKPVGDTRGHAEVCAFRWEFTSGSVDLTRTPPGWEGDRQKSASLLNACESLVISIAKNKEPGAKNVHLV